MPGIVNVSSSARIFQAGIKLQKLHSAQWGLDRIDQRSLPLDSSYRYACSLLCKLDTCITCLFEAWRAPAAMKLASLTTLCSSLGMMVQVWEKQFHWHWTRCDHLHLGEQHVSRCCQSELFIVGCNLLLCISISQDPRSSTLINQASCTAPSGIDHSALLGIDFASAWRQ